MISILLRTAAGLIPGDSVLDFDSYKPLPLPPADGDRPSDEQLLASLDVSLPQVKPPVAYGLAMGLLSAWLTLIPLAYLALLAFMSWLVVWHSLQAIATLSEGPFFVFHVPMAFLGGLLLLFLIKPVFFRRKAKDAPILTLREQDEPLLFAFVRKLCVASGSRIPTLIEVDCEPNAAARFSGGLGSLFGGKLVLRIGLPLVAALPIRQFAGVLAHEFGHFNQRSGMTGSYLIRRLTFFFAQVVFQRDRLDDRLARLRRHHNALGRGFYYLAVALIEPARGVLWLMLVLGELLTCGVLRRMEYDADNAEANVAGVSDFIDTSKLLMFLQIASQRTRHDLAEAWGQQRLADDMPAMIVANAEQLAEHRSDILKLLEEQKTRWLDTHPCHSDRVANVRRLGAAGLVRCEESSEFLFADFGKVCRQATAAFYKSVLSDKAASAKLVPTFELVRQRAGERKNLKALRRFFRNRISGLRPVLPGPDAFLPATDIETCGEELVAARQEMLIAAGPAGPLVEQLESAVPALAVARAQLALCNVFSLVPRSANLRAKAYREVRLHEPIQANALRMLPAFERAARKRLTTALRLLQNDDIAREMRDGDAARRSAAQLVAACAALQRCLPSITRLKELSVEIRVLFPSHNPRQPFRPLVTRVLAVTGEACALLQKLQADLALAPYPFEHATEGIAIASVLVGRLPDVHDPPDVYACVSSAVDRYYNLLFRALAKLTRLAETVETVLGLEALPEPPDKDGKKSEADRDRRHTRRYWLGYGGRALAGVTLLVGLIWLSINPPTFSVPWGDESPGGYKPNGFHLAFHEYVPPPAPYVPNAPRTPNMPHPGGPYGPATPYGPNRPNGHYGPNGPRSPYPGGAPAPYRPPSPTPYSPPSGWGGGGYGGGGGGRGGGGGHR